MAYGISDILELSHKYRFTYSITQFLSDNYGIKRAERILSSLSKPVNNYAMRINTLKTSQKEIINTLKNNNIEVKSDKYFKDIIYFPVKESSEITITDKYIIADKFRR